RVRAQRAHVQHTAHGRGARGGHHLGSELGVHGLEARASVRVQDPDEVDDGVAAGEQLTQDPRLMHVREPQLDRVEHAQTLGVREVAGGYAHPVPREREPDDQLRADKAAAAEHTDVHITPLLQRSGINRIVLPRRTSSTSTAAPLARSRNSRRLPTRPRFAPTMTSSPRRPAWAAALPGSTLRASAPPVSGASASAAPSKLLWMFTGLPLSSAAVSAITAVTRNGLPSRTRPMSIRSPTRSKPMVLRSSLLDFTVC